MFKNEYQGGACFEVFSAQGKVSQWKLTGSGIKKVFDKEVKSFVYMLEGTTFSTKIQLPKETKQNLCLVQGILVLQMNVPQSHDFGLELAVLDSNDQRCRLAFSTAYKETQLNPLHVKIPLALIKRAVWLNLCIDLRSIVKDTWKSVTYKSLESLCVSGSCKVRRIFTMRNQAPDTTNDDELYGIPDINAEVELESIPKQCQLATDVYQQTQVINSMKLQYYEGKVKPSDPSLTSRNGSSRDTETTDNANGPNSFHIAFGRKVPIPTSSRRGPLKDGNSNSRLTLLQQISDENAESAALPIFNHTKMTNENKDETKIIHKSNSNIAKSAGIKSGGAAGVDKDDGNDDDDDDDEGGQHVKPHPPRNPSSEKSKRRRPRVKSTSHDVNNSNGVALSIESSESQKIRTKAETTNENKKKTGKEMLKKETLNTRTDSESDSSDSEELNEIIKAFNENRLEEGNKENLTNGSKVYIFSSRPTCVNTARKQPRKHGMASAPAKKSHGPHTDPGRNRPASETTLRRATGPDSSYDRDFDCSDSSRRTSLEESPRLKPMKVWKPMDSRNTLKSSPERNSSVNSQTRQSINRKSLREIPLDELRRSECHKPYSFAKYQDDVMDSFEQQMLLSMQRETEASAVGGHDDESGDESPSQMPIGYDALTDSSDDMSTMKSPKLLKNKSHNYQEEMRNLDKDFLIQSNPRDWGDLFSPPIATPSAVKTSNPPKNLETHDQNLEEVETDEELDLFYDPQLHYFYDPHTSKYYELVTPYPNVKTTTNYVDSRHRV